MIKEITKDELKNYEREHVILDFYAPWCGPCRMLAPILEVVSREANIDVLKINIDDEAELANVFGVTAVPTVFVLEDGKVKNKMVGFQPKNNILKLL